MSKTIKTEVLVLGAGPGGYTAAFRAADLGKKVILVERHDRLGGVCLNVGCIPSKTLLHTAKVIAEVEQLSQHGVSFGEPKIDLDGVREEKDHVVKRLTGGLNSLAHKRKVDILHGDGTFKSAKQLALTTADGETVIEFEHAIIAVGSSPTQIPNFPYDDDRLMDSTDALSLPDVPAKLLIIGGGYIGLEMATVYHALGSQITVVEATGSLLPGADRDLVRPLEKKLMQQFNDIKLNTKVVDVKPQKNGLKVSLENGDTQTSQIFDRVLVAVGRRPNSTMFGADALGIKMDDRGFIVVDTQQRTSVSNIFAIGDIVGDPMLAHKATHEGKVAAEVIAGQRSHFDPRAIPAVVFTDPEIAWAGLTESEAKANGIEYSKGMFPWAANGRSLSIGRDDGFTKLLFDKETRRVLGIGITGPNAGDLIAEGVVAIEMGADAEDLALSIHPHPTLSETVGAAAEVFEGTATDIYAPKR